MQAILRQNHIHNIGANQAAENAFGAKIGIMGKLFGCWHKELSRPFTTSKNSYRTCLHCGARKRFDAQNLKTFSPFYYPPIVSHKENKR